MTKRSIQTHHSGLVDRAYQVAHRVQFSDPVRQQAMRHIHFDLNKLTERRGAFRAAPAEVRIQVISEIRARSVARQGSNAGSASSALVAATLSAAALVGSLFLAFFNGYYNWVVKMTDPTTGKVAGLSDAQTAHFLDQLTGFLFLIAFSVIVGGIVMFLLARSKDSSRGIYTAWLALYEGDHLAVDEDRRRSKTRRRAWRSI